MTTKSHHVLRLYVTEMTHRSTEAVANLGVLVGLEVQADAERAP